MLINDGGFLVFLVTTLKIQQDRHKGNPGTDHNIYRGLSLHARKAQQVST